MEKLPACPSCKEDYTYQDGNLLICPMCSYEWIEEKNEEIKYLDSNGNELKDGDTVTIIKDLKVKGSGVIKRGTKVKNIRLVNSDHNIDCKIDGFGAMALKSEFVKKV